MNLFIRFNVQHVMRATPHPSPSPYTMIIFTRIGVDLAFTKRKKMDKFRLVKARAMAPGWRTWRRGGPNCWPAWRETLSSPQRTTRTPKVVCLHLTIVYIVDVDPDLHSFRAVDPDQEV